MKTVQKKILPYTDQDEVYCVFVFTAPTDCHERAWPAFP